MANYLAMSYAKKPQDPTDSPRLGLSLGLTLLYFNKLPYKKSGILKVDWEIRKSFDFQNI